MHFHGLSSTWCASISPITKINRALTIIWNSKSELKYSASALGIRRPWNNLGYPSYRIPMHRLTPAQGAADAVSSRPRTRRRLIAGPSFARSGELKSAASFHSKSHRLPSHRIPIVVNLFQPGNSALDYAINDKLRLFQL